MCGRYFIPEPDDNPALERFLEEANRRSGGAVKRAGEAFPSEALPVVATNKRRQPGGFAMRWGYAMPDGRRVINARSETAGVKPLFKDGMLNRRCAVPASKYFEWRHSGSREKYAIRPEKEGTFYMAGLYRLEGDAASFVILTREPAPELRFIHDRMPVILPPDALEAWIAPEGDAQAVLERAVQSVRYEPVEPERAQLEMQLEL